MPRSSIIANWKMNKLQAETAAFMDALAVETLPQQLSLGICPPFTSLPIVRAKLASVGPHLQLGAQNCADASAGAHTGEVSAAMLKDAGCSFVLIGHSERRSLYSESDKRIAAKLELALAQGMQAVFCIGETQEQRDAGETERVLRGQLQTGLSAEIRPTAATLLVAYEPVWAIGTGRTAAPEQVQEVLAIIRDELAILFGRPIAAEMSLLYGGSVKAENIASFAAVGADGALVGGASLQADSFAALARAYADAKGLS